jgi:hypothetical protein
MNIAPPLGSLRKGQCAWSRGARGIRVWESAVSRKLQSRTDGVELLIRDVVVVGDGVVNCVDLRRFGGDRREVAGVFLLEGLDLVQKVLGDLGILLDNLEIRVVLLNNLIGTGPVDGGHPK